MGEEGMEEDIVLVFVLLWSEGQSGRRSLLKLLGLCLQSTTSTVVVVVEAIVAFVEHNSLIGTHCRSLSLSLSLSLRLSHTQTHKCCYTYYTTEGTETYWCELITKLSLNVNLLTNTS